MRKFTLFLSLFMACAMTALAQDNPIQSLDDLKSGKIYWFSWSPWLRDNGLTESIFWPNSSNEEYNDCMWSTYMFSDVSADWTDPRQQFALVEFDGKLYLYNIAAENFVSFYDDGAYLMDAPTSHVVAKESTYGDSDYPWVLTFDGDKGIASFPATGYEYCGYTYCNMWDEDQYYSSCQIYEVGEYAAIDSLKEVLAHNMSAGVAEREAAYEELANVLEEVDLYLYEEVKYEAVGGGKIELQVTDPTAPYYLSCSNVDPDEGSIEGLIDGDNATFMHSNWHTVSATNDWLDIDMGEGNEISEFKFSEVTRSNASDDFPLTILVQGSNNGVEYTDITTVTDLPQSAGVAWESDFIKADQPYRYLRFVVTTGNNRIFFHMAEFSLVAAPAETMDEKYAPYVTYVRELKALWEAADAMYSEGTAKTHEVNEMIQSLKDKMTLVKGLVSDADDPKTVEYIAQVEEIYALDGVGYPVGAARDTFRAAIDAAIAKPTTKARLDLEEALGEYYKAQEVAMPVGGEKYTLTFVTYDRRRSFINCIVTEEDLYGLEMVQDTLTSEGLPYPETAVFTCEDNGDGTYSFVAHNGFYLTVPNGPNASATGLSDTKINVELVKMYPNAKCETDVAWDDLFGLVAYHIGGTFPAPNSAGSHFYTGTLPHYMAAWTSAMAIEVYNPDETGIEEIGNEVVVEGIYDLSGRRVENPVKGIYIVNGKKVLVK